MPQIPIAVQLYSVHEDCGRDFRAVLKQVAEMGYKGVEFAGWAGFFGFEPEQVRQMLDDLGLKCVGNHTGHLPLVEDLEKTVEINKTLGNRNLIIGLMQDMPTIADWEKAVEGLNEIAAKLKEHDMRLGYHNHPKEFTAIEGKYPWDILASNLPDDVIMQIDTRSALEGGADPVEFIRKYPGRTTTIHLKERPEEFVLGEGDTDWASIFDACETVGGTEWYIVEQEVYPFSPMDCIRKCLENLKKMGK